MKHDLNLTLKMYKSVFSDKQITEIKKKMRIDPIFTYSDSEIALKVCRNKQRFKFNRRPRTVQQQSDAKNDFYIPFYLLNYQFESIFQTF